MTTEASASASSAQPAPPSTPSPPNKPSPTPTTLDLRDLLHQYISSHQLDLPRQQLLLSRLRAAGLLTSPSSYQHSSGLIRSHKRYLQVHLDRGSAFDSFPTLTPHLAPPSLLTLSLHLLHRRYTSHPVPASPSPSFHHTFLFPLQDEDDALPLASIPSLLPLSTPLHLALTLHPPNSPPLLLSTTSIEWRPTLLHGSLTLSHPLPLHPHSSSSTSPPPFPPPLLHFSLSLLPLRLPPPPSLPLFIEPSTLASHLASHTALTTQLTHRFTAYTTAWWSDLALPPPRTLPLLLPTDTGHPHFACTLLHPIHAGGGVHTPAHAARFVRLLPLSIDVALGGGRTQLIHSLNALLARCAGGVEDHALLLASLLLGFGLDAYAASGVGHAGPYMVALTRHAGRVTLWDACTGQRYQLPPHPHKRVGGGSASASASHPPPPLRRVWAVWNDRQYYANTQLEDDVELVDWALKGKGWRGMDEEVIALLPRPTPFPLQPCTVDPLAAADQLEAELRRLISAYRRHAADLGTAWCGQLSYTLGPVLTAYEWQRVGGRGGGGGEGASSDGAGGGGGGGGGVGGGGWSMQGDFEAAVQHSTPEGGLFRAVPFQFAGLEGGDVMKGMLEEEAFVRMMEEGGVGGELKFGVRVKVVPYCEEIAAVWVIVASTQSTLLLPPQPHNKR